MKLQSAVVVLLLAGLLATPASAHGDEVAIPPMPDATPAGKPHFDSTGVQVGQQLPDLPIYTLAGEQCSLQHEQETRGPALLITSSYSCPKSRSTYPLAKALAAKLGNRLPTTFIYVIEAHPKGDPSPYSGVEDLTIENQRERIFCSQPQTLEARLALAKQFQRRLDVHEFVYVDAMDNAVWKSLGGGPNMAFLVDQNGIVLARQGWFDAASMEAAATALRAAIVQRDDAGGGQFDFAVIAPTRNGDLDAVKSQIAKSPALVTQLLPYSPRGDEGDRLLLHYAVENKRLPVVELLVAKGANVNLQSRHAPSPLHIAAKVGDASIAKFLIDHGADVNAKALGYGPTPLQEALIYSNRGVAEVLVHAGAKPNLYTDVYNGNVAAVRTALSADATLAIRPDGLGRPPLAYAATGNQPEMLQLLLAAGAKDPLVTDYAWQQSGIAWAVHNHNIPVIELLGKDGVDPGALNMAINDKAVDIVRALLKLKVDLHHSNISGLLPLHAAVLDNQLEIVRMLIDAGADVNAMSERNRAPCGPVGDNFMTALHLAAEQGNTDIVGALLKHGAKADALSTSKETPLRMAVGAFNRSPREHLETVTALIAAGADVNAPARLHEDSILDIVIHANNTADKPDPRVIDLLRSHGAKESPKD